MEGMGKRSISSLLTVLFNAGWYVVVGVLALMLLLAAVSPFIDLRGATLDIPVSFSVNAGTLQGRASSPGLENVQVQSAHGSIRIPNPARALLAASAIIVVVMLGVVLYVLGQLHAVFLTLRVGRPFVPINAVRLRRIAYALIVGEVARSAVVLVANRYAMTHFSADGLRFEAPFDLSVLAIVQGLIILVIAEVFRAGTRLDEGLPSRRSNSPASPSSL